MLHNSSDGGDHNFSEFVYIYLKLSVKRCALKAAQISSLCVVSAESL